MDCNTKTLIVIGFLFLLLILSIYMNSKKPVSNKSLERETYLIDTQYRMDSLKKLKETYCGNGEHSVINKALNRKGVTEKLLNMCNMASYKYKNAEEIIKHTKDIADELDENIYMIYKNGRVKDVMISFMRDELKKYDTIIYEKELAIEPIKNKLSDVKQSVIGINIQSREDEQYLKELYKERCSSQEKLKNIINITEISRNDFAVRNCNDKSFEKCKMILDDTERISKGILKNIPECDEQMDIHEQNADKIDNDIVTIGEQVDDITTSSTELLVEIMTLSDYINNFNNTIMSTDNGAVVEKIKLEDSLVSGIIPNDSPIVFTVEKYKTMCEEKFKKFSNNKR